MTHPLSKPGAYVQTYQCRHPGGILVVPVRLEKPKGGKSGTRHKPPCLITAQNAGSDGDLALVTRGGHANAALPAVYKTYAFKPREGIRYASVSGACEAAG